MITLEDTVRMIYGPKLKKTNNEGYSHYMFTLYQDIQTKQPVFFKTIELPTFLYISEAITEVLAGKYGSLLPKLRITPIDRNFERCSYLVRSPINIIHLSAYLQIKRQCLEPLELEFFLRSLQFLIRAYKVVDNNFLPLFTMAAVGLTETGELVLCDPSLYFNGQAQPKSKETFGQWISKIMHQFLEIPLNQETDEQVVKQMFGEHLYSIKNTIQYLMSGDAILEIVQAKLIALKSRISQQISTVTGSNADIQDLIERGIRQSLFSRKTKFKKMGKLSKMIIAFVVVIIIVGVAFFSFKFFNRTILCQEGEYLNDMKQCVSCSYGCVRCENSEPNRCMKCDMNMYLVLDEEEDKEGFCLNECRGKLINSGVCVREKKTLQDAFSYEQNIISDSLVRSH